MGFLGTLNSIIATPLGWIMWVCYKVIPNYGVALILFTLITRLCLFPLGVKQQKSTIKMFSIKPKIDEITAKYKNNQQKANEELAALYQKEGYSPTSGCLPLLIQFPILFGLIDVIYKPLTHLIRSVPQDIINKGIELMTTLELPFSKNTQQLDLIAAVKANPSAFSVLGAENIEKMTGFNLKFLGLDLGAKPEWASILILIPILAALSSFILSWHSMKTNPSADGAAGGSMKIMMLTMPLISGIFAFSVPAGVGFYWIVSNIFMLLQTIILNKVYNPKEIIAKVQAEEEARKERERLEKIEAKKRLKQGDTSAAQKALSEKERNRQKLAEARKRMAEKYGDVYEEDEN